MSQRPEQHRGLAPGRVTPAALVALVVAFGPVLAGCPEESVVEVEIGEAFAPTAAFIALAATGGSMELRQGLQGAVMLTPAIRVTNVADARSGRLEVRIMINGIETGSVNVPLTDLTVGPDGASYDFGEFTPLLDDQIATYEGLIATITVAVVGGGFEGYGEVDVLMIDDMDDF